jgi:hypothetical protein
VVAPKPDHARLLDEFFGHDEPSHHPDGPARPAHLRGEGREGRADDYQRRVTPEPIRYAAEPLYEQARQAAGLPGDWDLPVAASQGRRR